MSILSVIEQRRIASILHFTTNRGILGILASRSLMSRQRLNVDAQLKHIFQPNAQYRGKDIAWLDFVNLSISRINASFFGICSGTWHREKDFWWCILDFSAEILAHDGVHFSNTNNIYTSVHRGQGEDGLQSLFEDRIVQWAGKVVVRPTDLPTWFPTCSQAEVLYPGQVSTEFLRTIHVSHDGFADELAAQMYAVNHPAVPIRVSPQMFEEIR